MFKGGGGGNWYFFVKLDFEIAVDQQTRTSDRTFEGVPDSNRQTVPGRQPRPYLVQIKPNLVKSHDKYNPCYRGRLGRVHTYYILKLDLYITVDRQIRAPAHDLIF